MGTRRSDKRAKTESAAELNGVPWPGAAHPPTRSRRRQNAGRDQQRQEEHYRRFENRKKRQSKFTLIEFYDEDEEYNDEEECEELNFDSHGQQRYANFDDGGPDHAPLDEEYESIERLDHYRDSFEMTRDDLDFGDPY